MRTLLLAVMAVVCVTQAHAQVEYQYPSALDSLNPYPLGMPGDDLFDFGPSPLGDFGSTVFEPYEIPDYAPSMPSATIPDYDPPVRYQHEVTRSPSSPFSDPSSPLGRYDEPTYRNTVLEEMQAERERAEMIFKSFRDTAPVRRRNALAQCALYNVGCAKELWGMGD